MNKKLHDTLKEVKILRAMVRATRSAMYEVLDTFGPLRFARRYSFEDRSRGSDTMLVVLAGYKPDLWDAVFGRLAAFLPDGIDVCVVISGKTDARLSDICREHGWSCLSTKRNNLALAQNTAIRLHPSAKWIYKMDEDIFLTEGVFERMKAAYLSAPERVSTEVGFVSPLIPINGYGHVQILRRLGLESAWESRFGRLMYTDGLTAHTSILENPAAARFMWGETEPALRDIDSLSRRFAEETGRVSVCPIRYSIGFILFDRELWNKFGHFYVCLTGTNLGLDEEQICQYCMLYAKAIVVVEDAVVGHFSYGPQTKAMLEYMKTDAEFARRLVPQK